MAALCGFEGGPVSLGFLLPEPRRLPGLSNREAETLPEKVEPRGRQASHLHVVRKNVKCPNNPASQALKPAPKAFQELEDPLKLGSSPSKMIHEDLDAVEVQHNRCVGLEEGSECM